MTLQRHIETAISAVICALALIWLSSCAVVAKAQILDEEMGWMLDAVTRPVASGAVVNGVVDTNAYAVLYEFETTNATQTLDTSGKGNHATNYSATYVIVGTNQYGVVKHGYAFNGSTSRLQADHKVFSTQGTNDFTIGIWLRSTAAYSASQLGFAGEAANSGTDRYEMLGYDPSSGFRVYLGWTPGGHTWAPALPQMNDGSWFMVVCTAKGSTGQEYVNGVLYQTTNLATRAANNTGADQNLKNLNIGWNPYGGQYAQFTNSMFFISTNCAFSSNTVWNLYAITHPTNYLRLNP
jgi:hypothetical protein